MILKAKGRSNVRASLSAKVFNELKLCLRLLNGMRVAFRDASHGRGRLIQHKGIGVDEGITDGFAGLSCGFEVEALQGVFGGCIQPIAWA